MNVPDNNDLIDRLKAVEKENVVLKKKFERCNKERGELESLLEQTRRLLEIVGKEKLTEEEQKQLAMFRKFVPLEFLQSLDKRDWLDIKLGDHVEHDMTVLFNDIRSFTLLSEKMSVEDNFEFINSYFKYIYPPIQSHGGFVDKYIGDAIMALFYHTREAIDAGIDMHKALLEYNKTRESEQKLPIEIGIGLHTGKLMLGIIGVEYRMQGTVISHTVNLASHLEALTKLYGSAMLVSHYVLAGNMDLYPTRKIGKVKMLGEVTTYMEIYEILPAEKEAIFSLKLASKPFFEEGIKLFFEKRFAEASVQFTHSLKEYPKDKAAQYYLKECAIYLVTPPPETWDGAEVL